MARGATKTKTKNTMAAKNTNTPQPGTTKIKFTKSPTGAFGLAYSPGDVVFFDTELANLLIETGFAQPA